MAAFLNWRSLRKIGKTRGISRGTVPTRFQTIPSTFGTGGLAELRRNTLAGDLNGRIVHLL